MIDRSVRNFQWTLLISLLHIYSSFYFGQVKNSGYNGQDPKEQKVQSRQALSFLWAPRLASLLGCFPRALTVPSASILRIELGADALYPSHELRANYHDRTDAATSRRRIVLVATVRPLRLLRRRQSSARTGGCS
jgi:hypothetical protein